MRGESARPGLTVLHVAERLGGMGGAEASLAQLLPAMEARGVHNVVLRLSEREWPDHHTIRESGVEILDAPPPNLKAQILAVRTAIRDSSPDLVHSCLWRPDLAARLGAWRRTPVLVSLVNTPYAPEAVSRARSRWRLEVYRLVEGLLARHLTASVHAITQAVADEAVRALHVSPSDIILVPRGRDASLLNRASRDTRAVVRKDLDIPVAAPVLANVARHEWQKGPTDLLEVVRRVRERHPDVVLLQMGRDGAASRAIRDLVRDEALERNVRLLGVRHDVPSVVAAADVFVFTSHWEGLGGSVLEAMAVGTPVAAFAAPAVVEILGGHGSVAAIGDVRELADHVSALLDDRGASRALAAAAQARFRERYTLDAVADAMVHMYAQVARDPTSATHPRAPM